MKKSSTIARLPEPSEEGTARSLTDQQRDAELLTLISKGGRSAKSQADSEEKRLSLRLPGPLAERVKRAAKAREVRTPVHTWIVEAILEQLKEESF